MASIVPSLLAEYTHEDFSVKYLGIELNGITELTVDEEQEFEYNYGNGANPVSYAQLNATKATGKIEMLNTTYLTIAQGLSGQNVLAAAPSDLIQIYEIEGAPQKVKFIYKDFKLTKKSRGSKTGDKAQKVAFDFVCSRIVEEFE